MPRDEPVTQATLFLRRGTLPCAGVKTVGTIEVLRDRAGVPHIYGGTTSDVYFGLGHAMAEDRLWQMDRLRRRALGRQAEILGAAYVDSDLLHHAVGIPALAEREVERTDDATRQLLEAFVAGINRFIERSHTGQLPPEFGLLGYEPEPFTVRDSIAILRGEWWSLNGRLYQLAIGEAARLLPESMQTDFLEPEAPDKRVLPREHVGMGDGSGSNNWAIAGSRTASGQAILSSDPHQPFWVPSSWYEYAIHGPDDHAAGAGHPGVPGLWFGSNGAIAWGITNNAASTRDLYREQVHPSDPNLYREGETWRRFDERTIEIKVRGEAPRRHVQRATVRGPIVNHVLPAIDDDQRPLSLRWVGHEHLDDVRALIGIGRARDWEAFRSALRDWSVAVFNFGYADRDGRVGYQCAGRVPLRERVVRGYREANDGADAWQGYVQFEALPHGVDPPRGYVASANQRVAPDDYAYPLYGSWASGYRATRLDQVLGTTAKLDRKQVIALQNDTRSCRAERLCPAIVDGLLSAVDPDARALGEALTDWDFRYTTDSIAPTVFETFMEVWQERTLRSFFPDHVWPLVAGQTGLAARRLERGAERSQVIATAIQTHAELKARFGDEASGWQWGRVHQAHWRHPLSGNGQGELDIGPAPVDGGSETIRNTGAGQPAFAAAGGAEYRLVVDFAEPDRLFAVQNIGNSGVPGTPHYADQFGPWLAGEYHVVSLRRAEVESNLERVTQLESRA
jgi:penicillin G amidase